MNIGGVSYFFAFVAYLVLATLLMISWRGRSQGVLIVIASFASVIWAGIIAAGELGVPVTFEVMQLAELARSISWCLFLLGAMDEKAGKNTTHSHLFRWALGLSILLLVVATFFTIPAFSEFLNIPGVLLRDSVLIIWVALSIAGMTLIEQIFRNSSASQRWAAKFLCLGVGCIFAYDFFMYSDALLFKRISLNLWEARGLVNGMAAPLIAIAIARNPKYELDIHVSRHVVFHTATIMGAGTYLLLMAIVGYFIRFYGGTWGSFFQIVFFFGAGLLLLILLFSDKIRARSRVFLSKHFFSYKHDYRDEWLKFTQNLAGSVDSVPERVIQSIIALTSSTGGMLWERLETGRYVLTTRWHMPEVDSTNAASLSSLTAFMARTQWVIDFDEYKRDPDLYEGLEMPDWLLSVPNAWLIAPLMFKGACIGFILVKRSELQATINWEDRDLLKTAGQQAASHLAQYQVDQALIQSRQFEAFNRLSAYIVHDLKNILAQQSLIVTNAEKHKHKPEFIDDVVATVKNSVARMTGLMAQMRSGERGAAAQCVNLGELLVRVVGEAKGREPEAELESVVGEVFVNADPEQLATVFGHIIQNAQDATDKMGRVSVRIQPEKSSIVVEVADTGIGMEPDFVRVRLFKPFDSTKGLTGMGVGAFESREYIRSLNGDISVESELGLGSTFSIVLPCFHANEGEGEDMDFRGVSGEGIE
ncbi:MAG: PEP-CTERM system histidine kinase PrsK [Porticoccus sp.]|nr:PEP-CTERM system histidine kinase PrsK [Porticoccus sp.]